MMGEVGYADGGGGGGLIYLTKRRLLLRSFGKRGDLYDEKTDQDLQWNEEQ